jgi:hypothetical protein
MIAQTSENFALAPARRSDYTVYRFMRRIDRGDVVRTPAKKVDDCSIEK